MVAWLCANGVALDAVQVFAWGRMFAARVEVLSIDEAFHQTFDGRHPCALCTAVERARAADHRPAHLPAPSLVKLTLFCHDAETLVPPVAASREIEVWSVPRMFRRDPVPVPPPRGAELVVG